MIKTRNTKQKTIILEYLKEHPNEHLIVEKIYEDLDKKVGIATIYRMLGQLEEEGIVNKISLNTQGFCYQYNNCKCKGQHHFHLICENCGKLVHFNSSKISETKKEAIEKEHFCIDLDKIVLYGQCENCKKNGVKKNER